jgi:hypothetical protein
MVRLFGLQFEPKNEFTDPGTMSLPSILLGFILATLYGAGFHFWRGGGGGRLLLYIALSWAGFWLGHWVFNAQGWQFLQVGPLQVGGGTLGSALTLLMGLWLGQIQQKGRI